MNTSGRNFYLAKRVFVSIKNLQASRPRPASAAACRPGQSNPALRPQPSVPRQCHTPARRRSNSQTLQLAPRSQTPGPRRCPSPFFKSKKCDKMDADSFGCAVQEGTGLATRPPLRPTTKCNVDLRPGSFSKKQILTPTVESTKTQGVKNNGKSGKFKELSRNYQLEKASLTSYAEEPRQAKKENARPCTPDPTLPWPAGLTEQEVVARLRSVKRRRPVRRR